MPLKISPRAELKAKKQAYVQDEILAAAAKLFAERGFRAVTIDDIGSSRLLLFQEQERDPVADLRAHL
jgi:hypothetical protein